MMIDYVTTIWFRIDAVSGTTDMHEVLRMGMINGNDDQHTLLYFFEKGKVFANPFNSTHTHKVKWKPKGDYEGKEVHMVLSSRMSVLKSVYEVYSNRYAIAGQCGPSCKGAGANTQRVCLPSARRDSVDERAGVVGPS